MLRNSGGFYEWHDTDLRNGVNTLTYAWIRNVKKVLYVYVNGNKKANRMRRHAEY